MPATHLPLEQLTRLGAMIALTIAFGGVGALSILPSLEKVGRSELIHDAGKAMASGIAFVVLPVTGLSILGFPLNRSNLSVAVLVGIAISGILLFSTQSHAGRSQSRLEKHGAAEGVLPGTLILVLLVFRLLQFRDAFVPAAREGLIHTTLLQDFLVQPAVLAGNAYPFGFYAFASVVNLFWGSSLPETILLCGQWLSFVCGISFYAFARRHIRNPYAAGLGFVLYSFALLFPTHLLSWGHYPLLLGLALLPPAITTSLDSGSGNRNTFPTALLLVISLGLTHLGMLVIWASYLLVSLGWELIPKAVDGFAPGRSFTQVIVRPAVLLLSAAILVFYGTVGRSTGPDHASSLTYDPDLGFGSPYVSRLVSAHDGLVIFLWAVLILWSMVSHRRILHLIFVWPLAGWMLARILYAAVGVPLLSYTDLIVVLSIPLAISTGLISEKLIHFVTALKLRGINSSSGSQVAHRYSIVLMIAIFAGIAAAPLGIDQTASLFLSEDMLAMDWIKANTPRDAGFLIRATSRPNSVLMPSDGGGWISFLTGRRTIIPEIGDLYDICEFATQHGVDYLYFGTERGSDGFDLRLSDLNADDYAIVYGTASVEIASLRCP